MGNNIKAMRLHCKLLREYLSTNKNNMDDDIKLYLMQAINDINREIIKIKAMEE